MLPIVIVQSSPTKTTAINLAGAARERDYDVQDISFSRKDVQLPRLNNRFPIFIYGSVGLIESWSQNFPELQKWVWFDHELLGAECWTDTLGPLFLNSGGQKVSLKEFSESEVFKDKNWHVRPIRNDKRPPGGLYSQADIQRIKLSGRQLWVSEPKDIVDEVRVWVVGSQPIVASQYRAAKASVELVNTEATQLAMEFAVKIAATFLPHEHCVLDVGSRLDGTWSVIEFNPIHCSGWYAADPGVILDAFVSYYSN